MLRELILDMVVVCLAWLAVMTVVGVFCFPDPDLRVWLKVWIGGSVLAFVIATALAVWTEYF